MWVSYWLREPHGPGLPGCREGSDRREGMIGSHMHTARITNNRPILNWACSDGPLVGLASQRLPTL